MLGLALHCPFCGGSLGSVTATGDDYFTCSTCRVEFNVQSGVVVERRSKQYAVRRKTKNRDGRYARAYDLGIERPDGEYEFFMFDRDGKADDLPAQKSSQISLFLPLLDEYEPVPKYVLLHGAGLFEVGLKEEGVEASSFVQPPTAVPSQPQRAAGVPEWDAASSSASLGAKHATSASSNATASHVPQPAHAAAMNAAHPKTSRQATHGLTVAGQSLHCPGCRALIGRVSPTGLDRVICPACQLIYDLKSGTVTRRRSKRHTIQRASKNRSGVYEREYEIEMLLPDGCVDGTLFHRGDYEDALPAYKGGWVSLFYLATKARMPTQELVHVTTHGVGEFKVKAPARASASAAASLGGLIGFGAGSVLWVGFDAYGWTSWIIAILASSVVYEFTLRGGSPRVHFTAAEQAQVHAKLSLVRARQKAATRLGQIQEERDKLGRLRDSMAGLRQQMVALGDAYRPRVDTVERGIAVLGQRDAAESNLERQYGRFIQTIDVELETDRLAASLGEAMRAPLGVLEELRTIEAYNEELLLQLESNAEVNQIARSAGVTLLHFDSRSLPELVKWRS